MTSPLRRPRNEQSNNNNLDQYNNNAGPLPPPNTAPTVATSKSTSIHDKLLNLLQEVFDADSEKKMFHFPVDTSKLPSYAEKIKTPTDLTKIKNSIESKKKNQDSSIKASDVYNELNLMISNALVFNQGKKNPYRKHAKKISKVIAKAWKKRQSEANGGRCKVAEDVLDVPEDEIEFMPDEAADDDEDEDYLTMMTLEECDNDAGASTTTTTSSAPGAGRENIAETVKALKEEAELPLEQLRAQYEAFLAKQKNNNKNGKKNSSSDDDDDDEDDNNDEEEEFDDSDDDWDEEADDYAEGDDEENEDSSNTSSEGSK